jgi:Ca2+-binding EF-hand superfamily protein
LIFDEDGSGIIDPSEISKVLEDLGLDKRNSYVVNIVTALRETNKKLTFEEFVDVVCSYTGEVRTKEGIRRVFNLYDK